MMRSEVLYFLEGAAFGLELNNKFIGDNKDFGKALMEEARRRYPDCPPPSEPVKRKIEL